MGRRLGTNLRILLCMAVLAVAPPASGAAPAAGMPDVRIFAEVRDAAGRTSRVAVAPGTGVRSGDGVQIRVVAPSAAYVYVLLYGSTNRAHLLHPPRLDPSPGVRAEAWLAAGAERVIPAPGRYLRLDTNPGVETVFVVASPTPLADVGNLLARMEARGSDLDGVVAAVRARHPRVVVREFRHIGALAGDASIAPAPDAGERERIPASASGDPEGRRRRARVREFLGFAFLDRRDPRDTAGEGTAADAPAGPPAPLPAPPEGFGDSEPRERPHPSADRVFTRDFPVPGGRSGAAQVQAAGGAEPVGDPPSRSRDRGVSGGGGMDALRAWLSGDGGGGRTERGTDDGGLSSPAGPVQAEADRGGPEPPTVGSSARVFALPTPTTGGAWVRQPLTPGTARADRAHRPEGAEWGPAASSPADSRPADSRPADSRPPDSRPEDSWDDAAGGQRSASPPAVRVLGSSGQGAGMMVEEGGGDPGRVVARVVTHWELVRGERAVRVVMGSVAGAGGKTRVARVSRVDRLTGLALLEFEAASPVLREASLAASGSLRPGRAVELLTPLASGEWRRIPGELVGVEVEARGGPPGALLRVAIAGSAPPSAVVPGAPLVDASGRLVGLAAHADADEARLTARSVVAIRALLATPEAPVVARDAGAGLAEPRNRTFEGGVSIKE